MSNTYENNDLVTKLTGLFNRVFEGNMDVSDLKSESRLIEDLGMNSIALLYMAMTVEEEFGIRFENQDFESLRTVGDVVALIESRL